MYDQVSISVGQYKKKIVEIIAGRTVFNSAQNNSLNVS